MFESLNSWISNTAQTLIGKLPFQTFESALILSEQRLAATGGWNPDDPVSPTGPGEPMSGESPVEAAEQIVATQLERIYQLDITANIGLRIRYNSNQDSGMNDSSVLAAIESEFMEFLTKRLGKAKIEFVQLDSYTGDVERGGSTTPGIRKNLNNAVMSNGVELDVREVALETGRSRFSLDETWNVDSVFFITDSPVMVTLRKYTNTTFSTLDETDTRQYILNINPVTFDLESGIVKPSS